MSDIERLQVALKPLAILAVPQKPTGNAGAYSIRYDDILRAQQALSRERQPDAENEIAVLKSDRENLHQRVRELLVENARLVERLGPRGMEIVEIGSIGHYVSVAVKSEIESLRLELARLHHITEQ